MEYSTLQVSGRGILGDFLDLPYTLYRNDTNWVAPIRSEVKRTLDPRRNPYFRHAELALFVTYRNSVPAARIAVVISEPHYMKFGTKTAFFGFFESIPHPDAVKNLFESVEDFCSKRGVSVIEGPFNPNHYSELGLQTDGFNTRPVFFQPYNPEYYLQLLKGVGFTVLTEFHTRKNDAAKDFISDRSKSDTSSYSGGFTARPLRMNNLAAELEIIREVFNDAFSDNWHFLPLTKEEYVFSAKFLRYVTVPDLITIVEKEGDPAAVLQCVLDVNPLIAGLQGRIGPIKYLKYRKGLKKIRRIVIYAVGIRKKYRHSRTYLLLLQSMYRIVQRYPHVETTWMSEHNTDVVRACEDLGLFPDKHFVILQKRL
jgi:hypothetical protein